MTPSIITVPSNGNNFFSSGLRGKVDALMDMLYSGGVNNPMDSIEQISYLLFLRLLTEKDNQRAAVSKTYKKIFSGKWERYSWEHFVTLAGDELFETVRGAIEAIHGLPGLSATGQLLFNRATLKIYDRPTLRAVVQAINDMDLTTTDGHDFKGDMYEYLLGKIAVSGTNGQFRTPRHIIDMIVAMVNPQPMEQICDPACGTAGFLISAFYHIMKQHTNPADLEKGTIDGSLLKPKQWKHLDEMAFTGYDNDANMVKIAILNLYLHGLEKANIEFFNPLTTSISGKYPGATYDVILANPPFAGSIQKESILSDINLPTRDTELLFLKWFIDHLAPGGRAGVIVPAGVLSGATRSHKKLRDMLLNECEMQAVVSMPSGVFRPYAGVSTAFLVFRKGGRTKTVWFYDITADGYSLDDKRTTTEANDIPDVLAKWTGREEGPNSLRIPVEKIVENDGSLAVGRYKVIAAEAVNHDTPKEILAEVLVLEEKIAKQAKALLAEVGK
ncbi:MAG: SAM-dependent DNA methyltransferase [Deltaproteobacteria bacterium]|nr:SAM-dependent DNA methyltransferase [Deltaproteobacteria bacterium]